jgi:hypothetical protein
MLHARDPVAVNRLISRLNEIQLFLEQISMLAYCSGDQVEKNEMGGSCSTYGGEERCMQGSGGET